MDEASGDCGRTRRNDDATPIEYVCGLVVYTPAVRIVGSLQMLHIESSIAFCTSKRGGSHRARDIYMAMREAAPEDERLIYLLPITRDTHIHLERSGRSGSIAETILSRKQRNRGQVYGTWCQRCKRIAGVCGGRCRLTDCLDLHDISSICYDESRR